MKKKVVIISAIVVVILLVFGMKTILDSLTFSDGEYYVYTPDGVSEEIWLEKNVFYTNAKMSFSYANELLLSDDFEDFEAVFFNCYDKYSYNQDIYYSIRTVFINVDNEYTAQQEKVLISCIERLHEIEGEKPNNNFMLEKNIMLQIELNREFGNYLTAMKLKKLVS